MNKEKLMNIILRPVITEKANVMAENNKQFTFEVAKNATKTAVRQAVELLFDVKVDAVKIVNVKSKPRRFGKKDGRTKAWKKAFVALKEGCDIDFQKAE